MEEKTMGTVIDVSEHWWFKLNTAALRVRSRDGAIFPHIVKVRYTVDGKEYIRRQWFSTGMHCPAVGQSVTVAYSIKKPSKARLLQ